MPVKSGSLPLSEPEYHRLIVEWNDTTAPFPQVSVVVVAHDDELYDRTTMAKLGEDYRRRRTAVAADPALRTPEPALPPRSGPR